MSGSSSVGAVLRVIYSAVPRLCGEEFTLGRSVTIGRMGENEISLPDREVSRHHARIVMQGRRYCIEDLGSLNGTFVDGERVSVARALHLVSGSEVRLGPNARLLFTEVGATLPANETLAASAPLADSGGIGPGRLRLDEDRREVWLNRQTLDPPLSPVQYSLLRLLASAPGRVFSRDQVAAELWSENKWVGISDEAIDAVVKRLRERLTEIAAGQQIVVTVRAQGFKLGT